MATPFDDWDLEDASVAISEAIKEMVGSEEAFDQNAAFIEDHDHWQDGTTWVGPNGSATDTGIQAIVLAAVERQFTPRDALSEVLDRMANALLKREPDVDFTPIEPVPDPVITEGMAAEERAQLVADVETRRAALEAEGDEMRALISAWWDRKKLWQLCRKAVKRARWAARGALRTWIAPGNLEEAEEGKATPSEATGGEAGAGTTVHLPSGLELAEALMLVELGAPRPDMVRVHTDPETQERVAVFTFLEDDEEKAELWYVDGDETVLRVVTDGGGEETEVRVQLRGRLPIMEMEAELLVTEPVRRQQNRLNFAESLMVRVAETGGFPERYTLNAEPNGVWLSDPPAVGPALNTTVHGGKTWYLHAAPRTLGAAITTDLVGMITDTDGGQKRATPGVVFRDPTDPEYAIKSAQHAYFTVLEQCKQGHLATESVAQASGIAYEQARADYEDDLDAVRGPLEAMIRETIEAAIAWAEAMGPTSAASFLDRFRVVVNLNVSSGPITPTERQQHNTDVEAGTLSRATAISQSGIEDVDAELERIMTDPASLVKLRTQQITAMVQLKGEGMSWESAAKIVGIDDQDLVDEFIAADATAEEAAQQAKTQQDEIAALLAGTGGAPKPSAGAGAAA